MGSRDLYPGSLRLVGLISAWCLLLAVSYASAEPFTEKLHYQALYQGFLTAGKRVPIADILLETAPADLPGIQGQIFETRMSVTSAAYPFIENTFPFRVLFRSLYETGPFISLALEKYQKTHRLRHEVTWMDQEQGKVSRYRRKQPASTDAYLPLILEQWLESSPGFSFYKFARHETKPGLVDHLTMLQALRHGELGPGEEYRFPVTDGKRLYDYRVTLEGVDRIGINKVTSDSLKLRFDGYRVKGETRRPDHRPVYVWMRGGERRVPLRFENRHPLGLFIIELTDDAAGGLSAKAITGGAG